MNQSDLAKGKVCFRRNKRGGSYTIYLLHFNFLNMCFKSIFEGFSQRALMFGGLV